MTRASFLIALTLCLSVGCSPAQSGQAQSDDPVESLPEDGVLPPKIRFGSTAFLGGKQQELAAPLASYLKEHHSIPTTIVAAKTYDDLMRLFREKQLDIAMISALTCVKTRGQGGTIPIATSTRSGSPTYLGYLVTRADAKLGTLASLRGKRVGWVSRESTSGFLFPRAMLRYRALDPDKFFAPDPHFGGNHRATLEALVEGKVDVAAVANSFVDPGPQRLIADDIALNVVAKTARIPFDCVVLRSDIARSYALKLRTALLSLSNHAPTREKLAETLGINGFVPYTQQRYADVTQLLAAERSE